jgi:hypothetical protein
VLLLTWQKEFCAFLRKRIEEKGYSCKTEFYTETGGRVDLLVFYPLPEPFYYSQVAAIEIEESHQKWVQVTTNLDKILTSRHVSPQIVIHVFRKELPADKEATLERLAGKNPLIVVDGICDFQLCTERVFLELNRMFKYNEEISSLLRAKAEKKVLPKQMEMVLAVLTDPVKKVLVRQFFHGGYRTFRQLVKETGLKELDVGAALCDLLDLGVIEKESFSTSEGTVAKFSPSNLTSSLRKRMEDYTKQGQTP